MIGQARRHRWRARLPSLGRAPAVRRFGNGQRLAQAGMGQHKVVTGLEQHHLIQSTFFALAERIDPASDRRHALANVEVETLHKGGIDGPAT